MFPAIPMVPANNFDVGHLNMISGDTAEQVITNLSSLGPFEGVPINFLDEFRVLSAQCSTRLQSAFDADTDEAWAELTDEPRNSLLPLLEAQTTKTKNRANALYYCVYIVLFWRHSSSFNRYRGHITPAAGFPSLCLRIPDFNTCNIEKSAKADRWVNMFRYRNVLVLGLAVAPGKRNQGFLMTACTILAEGRVHTTGGGQSSSADRRLSIYEHCSKSAFVASRPVQHRRCAAQLSLPANSQVEAAPSPATVPDAKLGSKRGAAAAIEQKEAVEMYYISEYDAKRAKLGDEADNDVGQNLRAGNFGLTFDFSEPVPAVSEAVDVPPGPDQAHVPTPSIGLVTPTNVMESAAYFCPTTSNVRQLGGSSSSSTSSQSSADSNATTEADDWLLSWDCDESLSVV